MLRRRSTLCPQKPGSSLTLTDLSPVEILVPSSCAGGHGEVLMRPVAFRIAFDAKTKNRSGIMRKQDYQVNT